MGQGDDNLRETLISQRTIWIQRLFQVSELSTKFVLSYSSAAIGLTIVLITSLVRVEPGTTSYCFLILSWVSLLLAVTSTFWALKLDARRIATSIAETDALLEILHATGTGNKSDTHEAELQAAKQKSKNLYKRLVVVSLVSEVFFVLGLLFTLVFVTLTVTSAYRWWM